MGLDAYLGNANGSDVMWVFVFCFFFAGEDSCVDNERHVAC